MDNYEMSALLLKAELGDMDDFPPEIQNTISNVYYRFNPLTVMAGFSGDVIEDYKNNALELAMRKSEGESIGNIIKALRDIKKDAEAKDLEHVYNYLITLILDIYKYRIDNAEKKSPIRRSIERKFKSPVEEIPNLYQKLKKYL